MDLNEAQKYVIQIFDDEYFQMITNKFYLY